MEDWRTPWWIRLGLSDDTGAAEWRTPSVCLRTEMLGKANVGLHSSRRYTKTERQTFGGRVTVPVQSATDRTPAWATTASPPPRTKLGRRADLRKTLGWITAAATAEVQARDDAIRATVTAVGAPATDDMRRAPAMTAGRVVVAAAHVDITTHYQTADGRKTHYAGGPGSEPESPSL